MAEDHDIDFSSGVIRGTYSLSRREEFWKKLSA